MKSKTSFTPGLWEIRDGRITVMTYNNGIPKGWVEVDQTLEANARLIAAAPELLAWTVELLKQLKIDHPNNMDGIKEHVDALIIRATGGDL